MQSCGAGGALHWETALQDEPKDEPCFIVFLFVFFQEDKKKKGRKRKEKKTGRERHEFGVRVCVESYPGRRQAETDAHVHSL